MARTRPVPRAALAAALLALAPLLACSGGSTAADCSPTSTKASVLATARARYLFDTLIPASGLDPAVETQSPAAFLDAITAEARAQGKDRHFSFLTTRTAATQYFDEGTSLGHGVGLRFQGTTQIFVTQVFGDAEVPGGSPAARAGFARGDEILAIAPGTAPAPSAAGLDAPGYQVAAILAADATAPGTLSAAFGSSEAGAVRDFRLRRASGAVVDVQSTTASYALDPVPRSGAPIVLDVNGRKVGYILLRTFINPALPLLADAVRKLADQGITDVIVDVRYNGGGLLSVADLLLDLLGKGREGKPTYRFRFNASRAAEEASSQVTFAGNAAAIAPRRVAFVMTGASASASELVASALAPYLGADVAVVGARSYGKPVGQQGYATSACPDLLYLVTFQLLNAAEAGGYFDGLHQGSFAGTTCAAADDLDHPLGDAAEASVAEALRWIDGGSCAGNPILPPAAPLARLAPAAWPAPPQPSLAQREVPGLY
jgi:C-terminal processing protease CtpA/Prc